MIGKSPGMVLCAHCGKQSADADCRACSRMVCPPCWADRSTCSLTHAWALDIADYAIIGIDGSGRYGLARKQLSFMQRVLGAAPACGILRLSDRAWIHRPSALWGGLACLASVSREGTAVWGRPIGDTAMQQLMLIGRANDPGAKREPSTQVGLSFGDEPVPLGAGVTRDDRAVWFIHDNLLQRYDLVTGTLARIPGLPQRLAIQAVDYDPVVQRLVIGTWAKLYVFSVTDEIAPQAHLDLGMVDVEGWFFRDATARCCSTIWTPARPRFLISIRLSSQHCVSPTMTPS